jgi:isoleucyl-tRNA synthetase
MAFQKAGLLPDDLRCPIDDEGCFTSEVAKWADMDSASSLVGKSVLGNAVPAVIELLRAQNALLAEETIEHRYPHDWKTKEPVIIRQVDVHTDRHIQLTCQSDTSMVCRRGCHQTPRVESPQFSEILPSSV